MANLEERLQRIAFNLRTAGRILVSLPQIFTVSRRGRLLEKAEIKLVATTFPVAAEHHDLYRSLMRNHTQLFELPERPQVMVSAVAMYVDEPWLRPYHETTTSVNVRFRERDWWYPLILFLDNYLGVVGGVRGWGYPKYFIEQEYRFDRPDCRLEARIPRSRNPYLTLRMVEDASVPENPQIAKQQEGLTVKGRRVIKSGTVPDNEATRRMDAGTGRLQVVDDFNPGNSARLPFSTEWLPLLQSMPEDNQAVCYHVIRTEFGMAPPEVLESG